MQSDAAAYIRCGGVLFLKETVEHFFLVLVLDANACIGHLYAYMFFFRHTYFIDRNHHASIFPIVLDGIVRLTAHEDGWIYGIFCAERHDPSAPAGDLSSATATAAIARTKDLKNWERLPDLKTRSQQRNVVLHPEFVNGKYALYTRPQDGFIDAGSGGGIGWALVDDMTQAEVTEETIIDQRYYHTIKEVKNGEGPHPIKTPQGWLHLAHGVRSCAAGLRYVLYMYMTALDDPTRVIASPAGAFMVPEGEERVGDVSNVLFTNGWIADEDGKVFIYYASSDTRMHVATSTVDRLVDYCMNTPQDGFCSSASVETLKKQIEKNLRLMRE